MNGYTFDDKDVLVSEDAYGELNRLLAEEEIEQKAVRITMLKDSCCGPEFCLIFDDVAESDVVYRRGNVAIMADNGMKVLIKKGQGVRIDYRRHDERGPGIYVDFQRKGNGTGGFCGDA